MDVDVKISEGEIPGEDVSIPHTNSGPGRLQRLYNHLRMACLGIGVSLGYFIFAAAVIWGILGLGIASLLRLATPNLADLSLLAAVGATVAPFFIVLSIIRAAFKRPRPQQIRQILAFIANLYPPGEDASAVEKAHHTGRFTTAVRVGLCGIYTSSLLIIIGFAATASLGYSELYSPSDLFAVASDDPKSLSIAHHFLFWLNIPFDLFLLDAPSTFGIRLTDLQPNATAYGFLTLILIFKLVLVSAVVNLVYLVLTTQPATGQQLSINDVLGGTSD